MNEPPLDQYEDQMDVTYRAETYGVRDNGAVFRRPQTDGRVRRLDGSWTFGRSDRTSGYMLLGSVPVHRIVATAFHGEQPSEKHVVDHIDTNRRNNRPTNLRWVSRLENLLLNPITLRKIELRYGSIEKFFEDPRNMETTVAGDNFAWMRSVTKEEAKECRDRLLKWAGSGEAPQKGSLGEWVYGARQHAVQVDSGGYGQLIPSLTPGASQRSWKTPSEFPLCPAEIGDHALLDYGQRLRFGAVFSKNRYGESVVVAVESNSKARSLSVICHLAGNPTKEWAVTTVTSENSKFVHEGVGSFFTLQGAVKQHCCNSGIPWEDSIDDRA